MPGKSRKPINPQNRFEKTGIYILALICSLFCLIFVSLFDRNS